MAMPRIHIDTELQVSQELRLTGDRARYLGRVLRLRPGDRLAVFNGDDGEFIATVTSCTKNAAVVRLDESTGTGAESPLRVHLVQGISRGERMDFVVQKATELGVKRISPVLTQHGVVKLDAARAAKRRAHWQGVAASACEQCGRTRPPLIDPLEDLNTWFGKRTDAADTDLILRPDAPVALVATPAPATKLCLLIGPEGGFSDKEYGDAEASGFTAVSLGPRVLRTETAAAAALAIVQSLWGDLGSLT